ncbi:MAG TPA: methyltransferase domain-containing protein [Candidatus Paceibacterota bacterium]|nr:methyltransferase domain-containing protein [Candidatus Paceibacterota bacterium]
MAEIKRWTTCRISGEPLIPLFSLGALHLSDFLPAGTEPTSPKVPLDMCLAPVSGLVQLAHTAPFEKMYERYWYRSGINESMVAELRDIATSVTKQMRVGKDDVWIDIGCNDGTLLSFLPTDAIRIGYDPNDYKELSQPHANLIVNDYFNAKAFKSSVYGNRKAKVITSIAMFYDLEDPHAFVKDVTEVLDKDGLWVIQMSYLPLMLEQLAFDNICHEHLQYYSLSSLKFLLDAHKLEIVDCQLNDVNGGSFRIYIRKAGADPAAFASAPYRDVAKYRVNSILQHEKTLNLTEVDTYLNFFKKASDLRDQTLAFLRTEKEKGKKIWAYGASTKGNTLLQWWGIDNTLVDGIAERSSPKFGLKTPGSNIPISSEEDMRKANPDYLLVLPWHFIDSFVRREQEFLNGGGAFIVPCPRFEIIRK